MDNASGDIFTQSLAAVLRRHKEDSGHSFDKLVELTGIPRASVERIINGKRAVSAYNLQLLCDVFDVSPGEVMDEANASS